MVTQNRERETATELVLYKDRPIGVMRPKVIRGSFARFLDAPRDRELQRMSYQERAERHDAGLDPYGHPPVKEFRLRYYRVNQLLCRDGGDGVASELEYSLDVMLRQYYVMFKYPALVIEKLSDTRYLPEFEFQSWSDLPLPAYRDGEAAEPSYVHMDEIDDRVASKDRAGQHAVLEIIARCDLRLDPERFAREQTRNSNPAPEAGWTTQEESWATEKRLLKAEIKDTKEKNFNLRREIHTALNKMAEAVGALRLVAKTVSPSILPVEVLTTMKAFQVIEDDTIQRVVGEHENHLKPRRIEIDI